MRTLAASLTAAQRSSSAQPYTTVQVREWSGAAPRPRFTRWYTGVEGDHAHAVAVPSDGSLNRLYVDATTELQRQRVASPTITSSFSTWTSFRAASRLCAIAAAGAELRAFTVDNATPTDIYTATSSDDGATWGAWSLLFTAAGTVTSIAAASDGTRYALAWTVAAMVYTATRSGGAWSGAAAWTLTFASLSGVAIAYRSDWVVLLTGATTTNGSQGAWLALLGDGYSAAPGVWAGPYDLTTPDPGTHLTVGSPAIATDANREWLAYREKDNRTGGYDRPYWSHNIDDPVNAFIREPAPFNASSATNTIALAFQGTNLWATTADGVWSASTAAPLLDLTPHVLAWSLRETAFGCSGAITLDNSNGTYSSLATGATAAAISQIRLGSELQLSPGYRRAGLTPGRAAGIRLSISGWDAAVGPGKATLTLHATGGWEQLALTRLSRSRHWAAGDNNVSQILGWLLGRGGFSYSASSASSNISSLQPLFSASRHEPLDQTVRRLLSTFEDRIRWNAGAAVSLYPLNSDASTYSYGGPGSPTPHPIAALTTGARVTDPNYARVFAGGTIGEAQDFTAIADTRAITAIPTQPPVTGEPQADAAATALLRWAQITDTTTTLTIRSNVGTELYDVIAITEPRLSMTAVKARVLEIQWSSVPAKGHFTQVLTLGDP